MSRRAKTFRGFIRDATLVPRGVRRWHLPRPWISLGGCFDLIPAGFLCGSPTLAYRIDRQGD